MVIRDKGFLQRGHGYGLNCGGCGCGGNGRPGNVAAVEIVTANPTGAA